MHITSTVCWGEKNATCTCAIHLAAGGVACRACAHSAPRDASSSTQFNFFMLNAGRFVTTCTGLIDEKMAWRTIFNHISASVFGKGHAARFMKKFGERPVVNTIAASLAYVVYDFGSWHASLWWQRRQVAHSIRRGSQVEVPQPAYVCDRTAIINGLHNLLHSSTSEAGLYKVS